jgi:hypothetical protein
MSTLWGSRITNDAGCTREIKSRIDITKAPFNKRKRLFFIRRLYLNLRKKLMKCYFWFIVWYGAENWTLWKVDQKYLASFEAWCWRRLEKLVLADRDRNEEVLQWIKEERNVLHTIKRKKELSGLVTSCVGTAFWNTFFEGKIEIQI